MGGAVDVRLAIQHNHIVSAWIFGDFMGQGDIAYLESALTNLRYDATVIATALAGIEVSRYAVMDWAHVRVPNQIC